MGILNRLIMGLCMVVFVLSGISVANAAEPKLDDNWHFTIIPYLWLPSIDGKMKINLPSGSGSNSFDIGSDSWLDNLEFAALLAMELEKGRWSFFTDVMYIDFHDDDRQVTFPKLPSGSLTLQASTGLKGLLIEGGPSYTAYYSHDVKFDVFAGVRYFELDAEATLHASTSLPVSIPSRQYSHDKSLVDPIVGVKGKFELGKGWFIPYFLDVGGFGINDEWSWQAFGGIGYHFSKLFSMTLGYRHLQYNFNDNGLLEDLSLSGGVLGFVFRF